VKQEITFTIIEKTGQFTIVSSVDVPENWGNMSDDNRREYLVKPVGAARMHPGQILRNSSRFQLATDIDWDILDFKFQATQKITPIT